MVLVGRKEALLNAFVRFIALLERTDNALGTLAFVWATAVVLGGFSDHLDYDFWIGTVIVFLEGFRAFSRESRSDDDFLFKTTGGIKLKRVELGSNSTSLYYVNAVIMPIYVWMLPALYIIERHLPFLPVLDYAVFVVLLIQVIVNKLGFYKFIGYISRKESNILLQLSPVAAILLAGFERHYLVRSPWFFGRKGWQWFMWRFYNPIALWFVIYILARFGSLGDHCRFHKAIKITVKVLRAILLLLTAVKLLFLFHEPVGLVLLLSPLLAGNLQTPMAMARIFFSSGCLFWTEFPLYDTDGNFNVKLAVKLLYIMVLCQGILYMAACILESFSFLPRRSLALGCGLVDKLGMESVDLYYEQAYDTFLQESLINNSKKMGLVTFAMDSLNSGASWEKKRAAVRILDSFLQQHKTASSSSSKELVSVITTSTKAVTTLINMLGWTVREDIDIRLFAAKVIAQLAPYLRIVAIPGTMQMVSSLFDAQDELTTGGISVPVVEDNRGDQQMSTGSNSGNTPAHQASLTREGQNNAKCCLVQWMGRFSRHVKDLRSIPVVDLKDSDSLPTLGIQILEGLAHDLHNCTEISKAKEILPKIMGFISCITGTPSRMSENIGTPSLRLVAKLANVKGVIGITLRQELSENPFLIGNLVEILMLEGSSSCLQQSELAMGIIAKLAKDKETRQRIGRIQVIIDKLVKEFLGGDESPKQLRAAAGEALAMLALDSPGNSSSVLMDEPSYDLIRDLANKLRHGEHICTSTSLLHSLCKNCRQVLRNQGPSNDLSSTLTVVMERIKDSEGKEMEALVGLVSQICSVLSENITPVLESFQDDEAFAKKLVSELNAHNKPTPDEFPNIRMLLVGLIVSVVEFCPRYAPIFREHKMVEALSKVEQYMVFFGSAGVVSEEPGGLPTLVARAKLLIGSNPAPV